MFLIDQSGSMTGDLASQQGQLKMSLAADAISLAVGQGAQ